MASPGNILPAIAPLGGDGSFPYPKLIQTGGIVTPAITFEGPTLIGLPMPGQWLLTKAIREFGWQKQTANFLSGASVVPTGDPPMSIEYEVRIFESGTMGAFRKLLGTVLKKPAFAIPGAGLVSAALDITDPALNDLGVKSVVVEFVDYPKNPLLTSGGKGAWVGKVGFIEFRKYAPALPVPNQDILYALPSAADNYVTAQASVTSGALALQAAAALALVPPR